MPTAPFDPSAAREGYNNYGNLNQRDSDQLAAQRAEEEDFVLITPRTRQALSVFVEHAAVKLARQAVHKKQSKENGDGEANQEAQDDSEDFKADERFIRNTKTLVDCVAKLVRLNIAWKQRPLPKSEYSGPTPFEIAKKIVDYDPEYQEYQLDQESWHAEQERRIVVQEQEHAARLKAEAERAMAENGEAMAQTAAAGSQQPFQRVGRDPGVQTSLPWNRMTKNFDSTGQVESPPAESPPADRKLFPKSNADFQNQLASGEQNDACQTSSKSPLTASGG